VNVKPDLANPWPHLAPCMEIHELKVCLSTSDPDRDFVFVWVNGPQLKQALLLELGFSGTGLTSRTVLYSIRPA